MWHYQWYIFDVRFVHMKIIVQITHEMWLQHPCYHISSHICTYHDYCTNITVVYQSDVFWKQKTRFISVKRGTVLSKHDTVKLFVNVRYSSVYRSPTLWNKVGTNQNSQNDYVVHLMKKSYRTITNNNKRQTSQVKPTPLESMSRELSVSWWC